MEIEHGIDALLEAIRQSGRKKNIIEVALQDSVGMIVAEDVASPMMVPPFPKSAMDGYAVCAGDVVQATKDKPVLLNVLGELCAGDYKEYIWESGAALRVMTGAYIPAGFDSVVRQEDTDYGMNQVCIYRGVAKGQNYCHIGEDIQIGQCVVAAGTKITPLHIGLLASVGCGRIRVMEPVSVAILSTGSELCQVGQELGPGKIYNSTAYALSAAIRKEGLQVVSVETCEDEAELLCEKLKRASELADIVITTGAVSVGKKDIIPEVTERLGGRVLFRGVNIQPGTPTMASVYGDTIFLNLSGNPYAALANFEIYFWPMVAEYMGTTDFVPERKNAILMTEYSKVNKLRRFLRAYEENGSVSIPSQTHASSVISNLTECNCFIDLPAESSVHVGDEVRIWKFR